jgi:stearoyl-CoA desaturase (delta-9 desaturase)
MHLLRTLILPAFVFAFCVTQVTILATTVYLHRTLSHRALAIRPGAALPFRVWLWVTTGMRPREWVAVHRKHHAATDTAEDPHSPIVHGFWRVQLGNVGLYKKVASDEVAVKRYARDLPADRLDRTLFDHALLGLGIGIAIASLFTSLIGLGWEVGLIGSLLHAFMYVMLSGAINAVGHTFGSRPQENSATNGQLLAFVTGGEGLHNNHHAAPTSATFALHGELDPGWWLIRALRRFGLATVRHDEVKLKQVA